MASPALLLQQVLRAHHTFLLHHAAGLGELYTRVTRSRFCAVLKRFWNHFVSNWDVLLNGNPALDLFNGLKLAAGGELGIGVGEEEWGSGEREVLEGFIGRTGGMVDMIVSRFGDGPATAPSQLKSTATSQTQSVISSAGWAANGQHPRPSDGVIFSGIGAITRTSIRDISCWGEDMFRYGHDTYGVRDNPSSMRWRRRGQAEYLTNAPPRSRASAEDRSAVRNRQRSSDGHGIPRPITHASGSASRTMAPKPPSKASAPTENIPNNPKASVEETETGAETMMRYLTLGVYGSKWGIPFKRQPEHLQVPKIHEDEKARSVSSSTESVGPPPSITADEALGYYLIGFRGDLESSIEDDEHNEETGEERADRISDESQSSRTMLRTLYVNRLKAEGLEASDSSDTDGTASTLSI